MIQFLSVNNMSTWVPCDSVKLLRTNFKNPKLNIAGPKSIQKDSELENGKNPSPN